MKSLKKHLNAVIESYRNKTYPSRFDTGEVRLAQLILREYLPDSKFCQCELCKKQHQIIQEGNGS